MVDHSWQQVTSCGILTWLWSLCLALHSRKQITEEISNGLKGMKKTLYSQPTFATTSNLRPNNQFFSANRNKHIASEETIFFDSDFLIVSFPGQENHRGFGHQRSHPPF